MAALSPLLAALRRLLPLLAVIFVATSAMLVGFLLGRRPARPPAQRLDVTVVNVGNGEAAWLRTPTGKFILIGAGPPGAGRRVVDSLRAAGARRIDLLILPYPYVDAIGGVPEVLRAFPVRGVFDPGYPSSPQHLPTQEEVRGLLAAAQVPIQVPRAGQDFRIGDVRLDLLAPAQPLLDDKPREANNSIVLRVTFGQTAFLFAGGLERDGENALLARAPELQADWLRVSRFGTRGATSAELLRLVRPSVAVISVGKGNAGGYPHRETLECLAAAGARVYRTDQQDADLSFWSDGQRIVAPEEPR
uniref:Metallo-beta-lactamase domain-containing protein n=1 Tax=uncultured Armatimonadetes bacterium TaxID=157466 RepID=A0A6J4K958_9BACT|nr:hypothetical protein AVDCRST_MAG63-5060 [uncultured Armatimonadetes bacterium]